MKRILQILPALETGGVEQTTLDIAHALIQNGDVAFVASCGGRLVPKLTEYGAHHFTLPLQTKNPLQMLCNAYAIKKLIDAYKIDLIHARSRAPAWSALKAARMCELPFITTYHGIYKQKNIVKGFYNSVMARGDCVIANSYYTQSIIEKRHSFARKRVHVIERGTDMTRFSPQGVSERRRNLLRQEWNLPFDARIILQVARLTQWKGQEVLIRAFAPLAQKDPQLKLILAGDAQGRDHYVAHLKELCTMLKISQSVHFAGHVSDVPAALSLADCVVVASIEPEAFGRAAVEAQAMEKAVIVSKLGAVPETVLAPPYVPDAKRTGWHIPAYSVSALHDQLNHVMSLDKVKLNQLTSRARAHVKRHFDISVMCQKTLNLYDKTLKEHHA